MQSLLLIRSAPDKRALRRSLRGKPLSTTIGADETGTRIYPVYLPVSEDMGPRLTRRTWRRIEGLARDRGIMHALAPGTDRKVISTGLYARGITLLDAGGVRQYLTVAAVDRLFHILGRETVAEISACVEAADSRWGPMWVSFLSEWVRDLTVSGRGERLERLQREMLARDGTVLAIGRQDYSDIRILLGSEAVHGDERILIDGRPVYMACILGALYCGWPAVPEPAGQDMLTLWERTLAGIYHNCGRRFFSACTPPRDSRSSQDVGGLLKKAGIQVKGFLTDTTGITLDRMRYQFLESWKKSMADRKQRRLDNYGDHDL